MAHDYAPDLQNYTPQSVFCTIIWTTYCPSAMSSVVIDECVLRLVYNTDAQFYKATAELPE